jgi:NitT/TauT family transport system substrate-binding protein
MKHRPVITFGSVAIAALVLLLWTAALQLPTPTQAEPLRVAVGMWAGAEPWILARQAGELDPREVSLVEINWTSAAMRAVGNRAVDAAVLSLDEVIRQINQGYPLKIVMVTDISRGADLLMAKPGIDSVAGLKGGRIGYEPRSSGSWLLSKALKNSDLKLSDVQPVPLNPAEVEEIFEQLSLDGVVVAEPWKQRMKNLNLNKVYDSSYANASIVRVLAVHPASIVEHREELLALMRAHFKWMPRLTEGGSTLHPILRREGVSAEAFTGILKLVEAVGLEENRRLLQQKDAWLGERFVDLQEGLVEDPGAGTRLEPTVVFDPSLLEVLP